MQRLMYMLLGALGFTTCGCMPMDMYGTPTADYTIKGKVTDAEGNAIKGIVVSPKFYGGEPQLEVVTAEDGTFATDQIKSTIGLDSITFTDTDGEANGGDFQTVELDADKLPQTKVAEGDGWYEGVYEVTADVKLEKK